jgi:transposase
MRRARTLRCDCLNRDVNPNIPLRANRDPDLWAFDPVSYKERNGVERLFAKAKQFRRIATRYEKLKVTYLGLLHLVLGFIRLRRLSNVNRPYSYSRSCYNSLRLVFRRR